MNVAISRAAMNSSAYEGMATTIVLCWLLGRTLWVAHAGDSRLYRSRGGELEQLTRDHSFSQELLDAGMVTEEEARQLPSKNLVTRALGASPDVEPEINDFPVRVGDILMLCSDGLTEMVSDQDIETQLQGAGDDIESAAAHLVDMANQAGGRDNISVLLIRIAENTADVEPWPARAGVDATAEAADGIR
jgi:serine/threonine protein phosphatase PrpC